MPSLYGQPLGRHPRAGAPGHVTCRMCFYPCHLCSCPSPERQQHPQPAHTVHLSWSHQTACSPGDSAGCEPRSRGGTGSSMLARTLSKPSVRRSCGLRRPCTGSIPATDTGTPPSCKVTCLHMPTGHVTAGQSLQLSRRDSQPPGPSATTISVTRPCVLQRHPRRVHV